MKILKYKYINEELILNGKLHYNIIIENADFYQRFVYGIKNQIDNGDEFFIYSENYIPQKTLPKAILITDLFNLDINDKKIISFLYKKIEKESMIIKRKELDELNESLINFLDGINDLYGYNFVYNENISLIGLFKIYDLKHDIITSSFLEALIHYLKIISELCNISLFFTLNLNSMLSKDEIAYLYKELDLLNIDLINISPYFRRQSSENERNIIIDHDLCEIN